VIIAPLLHWLWVPHPVIGVVVLALGALSLVVIVDAVKHRDRSLFAYKLAWALGLHDDNPDEEKRP
jgi:hypothetical protein